MPLGRQFFMGDTIGVILILGLVVLGLFLYFKFFKLYKVKNIVFVDGALGTGKSFFSVALAVRLYKKQHRIYTLKKWLLGFLSSFSAKFKEKLDALEEPVLYSNIRLRKIKFTKLTKDLLFRKNYRFSYKSVLLIDEFSLLADQFCYKDREMSERLSNFFKLFRHETKGGYIVINSQSTSDLHYSLKYVLSDYLYLHHTRKFPFVCAIRTQELAYTADKDGGSVVNVRENDIEETLKVMLVLKKYFKYYDTYCYSIFTDDLPVYRTDEFNPKKSNIKDANLISFKAYRYLTENIDKEKTNETKPKED